MAGSVLAALPEAGSAVPDTFPTHPPSLAKEMVTVAHGNAERVRVLLAERPVLANAAWDWGFGDWETALGAASHTGNRVIAELLLAHGAHPTLFSATMLGQLEVVRAMVTARPGVERTLGPHSISLLAHARAGGPQSGEVLRYLQSLGDAGGLRAVDASEEELERLVGEYQFGSGPDDRIAISRKGRQLFFKRQGADGRPLHYLGDSTFRPAGASGVRIAFDGSGGLTVHDGGLVVRASRRLPVRR